MPNKVYTATETKITFGPYSGANNSGFTTMSLLNGSGCISQPRDFGSSSRSSLYKWQAYAVYSANPAPQQGVDIYVSSSEQGLNFDGNMASGDYHFADVGRVANMKYIGSIINTNSNISGSGEPFITSGTVHLPFRFNRIVWLNNGGANLSNGSGNSIFELWPIPDEIQ